MGPHGISLRNGTRKVRKKVTGMISITSAFLYTRFVAAYTEHYDMQRLLADKATFTTFIMCRYAAYVTFQQSCKLGGSIEEMQK